MGTAALHGQHCLRRCSLHKTAHWSTSAPLPLLPSLPHHEHQHPQLELRAGIPAVLSDQAREAVAQRILHSQRRLAVAPPCKRAPRQAQAQQHAGCVHAGTAWHVLFSSAFSANPQALQQPLPPSHPPAVCYACPHAPPTTQRHPASTHPPTCDALLAGLLQPGAQLQQGLELWRVCALGTAAGAGRGRQGRGWAGGGRQGRAGTAGAGPRRQPQPSYFPSRAIS